jgi:iron complex transport system substrate-binding protein
VRILSLLPSATEIVYALGLEDDLVGVTAECDAPAAARSKPVVSWPVIGAAPDGSRPTASEIDRAVVAHVAALEPLYRLDEELIGRLAPDLILAQDLCRVCAVPSGDVTAALDRLGTRAEVLSLDPGRLDEVIATVAQVGVAAGTTGRADQVVEGLRARVAEVRRSVTGAPRRRVLALEWSDPPYQGGHWVPDMVDAAGGEALLAEPGERSRRLQWDEVVAAGPDVVAFIPCGYGLDEAVAEASSLLGRPELDRVPEVWALDGSAYFSRPGPRVVDGVELLAGVLHPDLFAAPHPQRATRVR